MTDNELVKIILKMQADIAGLKHMIGAMQRFGTVEDVDHDKRRMRMVLSEENGEKYLSPWRPWAELAGGEKSWRPPTKGQQMMLVAPNGDLRQALAIPMTFSNENSAPSNDAGTRILSQFGDAKMFFDGDGGRAELKAPRVDIGGGGGRKTARVDDLVHVKTGSSAGFWPIVTGSGTVFTVD